MNKPQLSKEDQEIIDSIEDKNAGDDQTSDQQEIVEEKKYDKVDTNNKESQVDVPTKKDKTAKRIEKLLKQRNEESRRVKELEGKINKQNDEPKVEKVSKDNDMKQAIVDDLKNYFEDKDMNEKNKKEELNQLESLFKLYPWAKKHEKQINELAKLYKDVPYEWIFSMACPEEFVNGKNRVDPSWSTIQHLDINSQKSIKDMTEKEFEELEKNISNDDGMLIKNRML